MLSHETTTFDEIPLAEVSNKWNCFDSVNKKLFELVSKQILLQFLVTLYQWNWFFSKNRSNRMMLSVWFLVFWQINHVKFNNKECAKKGFIFSLYILLAIYENVGVEQSLKRTMNKYWFFPSLFCLHICRLFSFHLYFLWLIFSMFFKRIKCLSALWKGTMNKLRTLFIQTLNVFFFVWIVVSVWSKIQTNIAFVVLRKFICPPNKNTMQ